MQILEAAHAAERKSLGRHVQKGALAVAGERDLARIGLQVFDEFRGVLERRGRVHDQRQIVGRNQGDRREVLQRVVRHVFHGVRNDRHVAALSAGDGVAVRRRLRGHREADRAARAGPVVDDQLLAEALAHLLAEQAGQGIAGVAGQLGDDEAYRPGGIILRQRRIRQAGTCDEQPNKPCDMRHGFPPDDRPGQAAGI